MRIEKKLIKNTGFVFFSGIADKIFSLIFIIYAARVLGPANFGIYALIGSVSFLFFYLANFGIGPMAVREIARDKNKAEELFSHVLSMRITLSIIGYPVLVMAANLLGYSEDVKYLIYISGLSAICLTFSESFGILYRAFEKFKFPSVISVLVSFLRNLSNIFVLYLGYGLKGIVLVSLIGTLTGAVISGIWIRKRFLRYRFVFNFSVWKGLFSQSIPFAILSFFQRGGAYLNILLLSKLPGPINGNMAMGYYNPSASIGGAVLMLPQSFWQAALPTVAANAGNLKMVGGIIEKSTKSLLSVVIVPLIIAATFFPGEILVLIFGEKYLASAPAFTILGWAYALQVFNAPVSVTLSASREIRQFIPWAALVVGINIVLAVPLIMYYSFVGAAIAFLISKIVETILRHYLLQTIWGIKSLNTLKSLLKLLAPIILIFIILSIAKFSGLGIFTLVSLALILYFLALFFIKDLRQGIAVLIDSLRRRKRSDRWNKEGIGQ